MSTTVPLSTLLTSDVPYEWHDAVAIVAQVIEQADLSREGALIPDARGIALEEGGTLQLMLRPSQGLTPMPGAAQLLQQLLSGKEQPTLLRLFAMQAATAEPIPGIEAFSQELARWERPNRQGKLAALYARAVQHIGEERVQAAVAAQVAREPDPPSQRRRAAGGGLRGAAVIGAALAGAIVVGGAVWFVAGRPALGGSAAGPQAPSTAPGAPPDVAAAPPAEPVSVGGEPLSAAGDIRLPATPRRRAPVDAASGATAVPADVATRFDAARDLFERQQYQEATQGFVGVVETLRANPSPEARQLSQVATELAEVSRVAIAGAPDAPVVEYQAGDAGVLVPRALTILPKPPRRDTPPERIEVLELHINEAGGVDAARFLLDRPSFRNRWLVSAAKAWRFTPAVKDGQPVRFVARIVLDDGGEPR